MDAAPGGSAAPRQLTTFEGPDNDPETESRPAWSPDGRSIAYLQGGPLKLIYYAVQKLAVVPAAGGGGAPRILTAALDRNVANPVWSSDGSSIYFQLEDDRTVGLARAPAAGGGARRPATGGRPRPPPPGPPTPPPPAPPTPPPHAPPRPRRHD